jgi:hypothetical protein
MVYVFLMGIRRKVRTPLLFIESGPVVIGVTLVFEL